jgi:hypothetical protein
LSLSLCLSLPLCRSRVQQGLKQRMALAVDHFNKDYKKGFQFLQVREGCE